MIGNYVTYKGMTYIIVGSTDTQFQLLDVVTNKKLLVLIPNVVLQLQWEPMRLVNYRDTDYLVSAKGTIISMKTKRTMKWSSTDGNRLSIMSLAQ